MSGAGNLPGTDQLEAERARLFALLGRLLMAPPDRALLDGLRHLPGDASPLGRATAALAEAARAAEPAALEREFHALFIGVGRGEVLPYASYYLTGFLHERPLARLRGDLARLGVTRAPGIAEPEDALAFLCETYAGLLGGVFAAGPAAAPAFLATHLLPWAGRCFADIEAAAAARFWRSVAALGRLALDIEQSAADLAA
ncbi:TorD/DmsD family molecular chaperone [Roseomonas sp. BN140053]|uniref:TorD/DmsD family molecular chaperone n=1 Tax=Roseomonas sp. BN140053 TaxID=3391898 RepID=UPI0039ED4E95